MHLSFFGFNIVYFVTKVQNDFQQKVQNDFQQKVQEIGLNCDSGFETTRRAKKTVQGVAFEV